MLSIIIYVTGVRIYTAQLTAVGSFATAAGRIQREAFDGDFSVKYSRSVIAVWASLAVLALSNPVATAQDQGARSLAANCTGCHGPS